VTRKYEPQVRKRARELFLAGLSFDEITQVMRSEGYTYLGANTVRRWEKKGGWKEALEKLQAEEGRAALSLDAERVTAEMLESYGAMRTDLLAKIKANQVEFADGVGLLLKIDGLRRHLLAQSGKAGAVDKVALAMEVLELVVKTLAEKDPASMEMVHPHIPALGELIKARYAELG